MRNLMQEVQETLPCYKQVRQTVSTGFYLQHADYYSWCFSLLVAEHLLKLVVFLDSTQADIRLGPFHRKRKEESIQDYPRARHRSVPGIGTGRRSAPSTSGKNTRSGAESSD